MSWEYFVDHYQDTEQAYRDSKYTWRTPNHDYYVGTDPPNGSEPLGILYPRAGTLGGCGNHNAMNLALPPDNDWEHIANLTEDATWGIDSMRGYFKRIERNYYISPNSTGAEGHGYDGWLGVRFLSHIVGPLSLTDYSRTVTKSISSTVNQDMCSSSRICSARLAPTAPIPRQPRTSFCSAISTVLIKIDTSTQHCTSCLFTMTACDEGVARKRI